MLISNDLDAEQRARHLERRLAAVVTWVEANQPDAFQRGLWDAMRDGVAHEPPAVQIGTHPMIDVMLICDAYESGMGQGLKNRPMGEYRNPYDPVNDKHTYRAYSLGYDEGAKRTSQPPGDGPEALVHALEVLRQRWSHNVSFEATIGACKDEIELCIARATSTKPDEQP